MFSTDLHKIICKNSSKLNAWYDTKRSEVPFAITTSIDIRDSGFKMSSVDANIYPAGFNNICEADRESAPEVLSKFINSRYDHVKKILLITEEHTSNPYYWENVFALSEIIRAAGFDLRISMPSENIANLVMDTASGKKVQLVQAKSEAGNIILADGFVADLVISNNDFSDAHATWFQDLDLTMNPPRELGWYQRKKSTHFRFFNAIAEDFCQQIGIDPWLLSVPTELMTGFNPNDEDSKKSLALKVDTMLAEIQKKYLEYDINMEPSVFIKNNAGTYGLAVTKVKSGAEVMSWNNKTRTKMKAAKGGNAVSEIIIQEGIPSNIKSDGSVAEPVIYMFGCQVVGGFLRTHSKKDVSESLNSPGAVYRRFCMTDMRMEPDLHLEENVYGWLARISSLAVAYEAREMSVEFKNYKLKSV